MGIHHSHLKPRNLATWRQKPRPSTTQHWTWRRHDTSATVRGVGTSNPRKNHAAEAQSRAKAFHCSAIKTHSRTPQPCHIQSNSVLKNKQRFHTPWSPFRHLCEQDQSKGDQHSHGEWLYESPEPILYQWLCERFRWGRRSPEKAGGLSSTSCCEDTKKTEGIDW